MLVTDLTFTASIDDAMANGGWVGGSLVTWAQQTIDDTFTVTYSDGTIGGFVLWGSNEPSDQYSAYTGNQVVHRFVTIGVGTWILSTVAYEVYTLESRLSPPLVKHTYRVGERLKASTRGLWYPATAVDEYQVISDPRGENTYLVGSIVQAPSESNDFHLMIQTAL